MGFRLFGLGTLIHQLSFSVLVNDLMLTTFLGPTLFFFHLSVHLACWKFDAFWLFLTKTMHLATVIFWMFAFSSAVSCKISLLLHYQCPNLLIDALTSSSSMPQLRPQALKFYIYHQLPKFMQSIWYTNSLEQLYSDKVI